METNNKLYHADLYLRLSREDGDKVESDSIANQRDLLLAFLSSHPEIQLHTVRVDDGYSGVDYNRPDFQRMMESVKNKEINCIIVKDFSRLGRNFIETGKYIERIFPFMGVRFISVNDDYDSVRPRTSSDSLIVPVKNLINDAYCRDISIKIRSHLEVLRPLRSMATGRMKETKISLWWMRKLPLLCRRSSSGNLTGIPHRRLRTG